MCLELQSVAKKRFLEIFLDIFKSIDIFNFTDVIMCLNLSVWHLLELPMMAFTRASHDNGCWRYSGFPWRNEINVYYRRLSIFKNKECKGIFVCKAHVLTSLEVDNKGRKKSAHTSTLVLYNILFHLKGACRTTH